jgi:hypothetical protein
MSQSRNAEELKHFVQNTRKINGQTLDNDVQIDNVASADKLKTARTISLSGAVKSTPTAFDGSKGIDIPINSVKEAYLDWGGQHRHLRMSPVDYALIPELYANRLAFIPDSAVKFERSADSGISWTDVSDDFNGTMICTGAMIFGNGNTTEDKSTNRQHRITIDCIEGQLYGELAKIILRINTEGAVGCKCKVEGGDTSDGTIWTDITEAVIVGWPSWNCININSILVGTERSYRYVRLTFSITGVDEKYASDLQIMSVRFIYSAFFGMGSSIMARSGVIYSVDSEQNVTFPNNLAIQGNTLKIGNTTLTETQLKALLNLLTT